MGRIEELGRKGGKGKEEYCGGGDAGLGPESLEEMGGYPENGKYPTTCKG